MKEREETRTIEIWAMKSKGSRYDAQAIPPPWISERCGD